MRPLLVIIATGFLASCAHTPKVEISPVNITPVTQMKSAPFDPAETRALAESHTEHERYQAALKEYSRLLAHDPNDFEAKLGAGNSFLALGNYGKAASIFWGEAPDILSNDWSTGKTLSGIYFGKFENNETAIHDGMMIAPNDPRLWNAKGRWHDQREEWQEALLCYVTALDTGESQSATINNMGMSLMLQKRYSESLEKFAQAKSLSPDTEIYDNNLRMNHILLNNLAEALMDIDEHRASDIFNDAGYVAIQQNNIIMAERFFEKAMEISPVFHVKANANLSALKAQEQTALP